MIGGTLAGRYAIVRELGAGGMGTVYEAVQLDLERTVAIKVLHPEASRDEKASARLRHEAMAAARLGHPNVVEVFEVGTADDGAPFIVMERLVGVSLKGVLASRGRLSTARAIRIALQMLDALGAAHAMERNGRRFLSVLQHDRLAQRAEAPGRRRRAVHRDRSQGSDEVRSVPPSPEVTVRRQARDSAVFFPLLAGFESARARTSRR